MARPDEGQAKPRWPWTEGMPAAAASTGRPATAAPAPTEQAVAVAGKPRRFGRVRRHVAEPDGVTWLGESQVVKALEAAEARASRRRNGSGAPADGAVDEAGTGRAGAVAEGPGVRGRPFRRKKACPETSPMEAAGAAAAAAGPGEHPGSQEPMTDTATEEQEVAEEVAAPPRRRIGWLGSKQVAAAVALILAAEVGYIVHLNTSSSSGTTRPPRALPALSVPPPASTLPSASLPVTTPTTAPPATKAASAPAPTVPARTSAAVVPPTTPPPPPEPCTAGDLSFSTTTDRASYTGGEPVIVVTKVTDLRSCIFTPTAPAGSSCPTSITVDYAGGGPAPMGTESCTPPARTTMNPGSTETFTATLPAGELSPGSYTAVGTWGWATEQGTATATPASATFTVSS